MDLITLGEALIDLPSTQSGVTLADAPAFAKVPAGAPANVAVAAARLGLKTAFLSKVGDDGFGDAIIQTFQKRGVDTARIIKDPAARTGLAFVSIRQDGERDFLFYFDPARDLALRADELDLAFLKSARAFHYGSISLIAEPSRTATLTAARAARAPRRMRDVHQDVAFDFIGEMPGALVSYDPNLRPALWPDEETIRHQALAGFAEADVAKVSKDEVLFLTQQTAQTPAARHLLDAYPNLQLVCVTDGAQGSAAYGPATPTAHVPGFAVEAVDATGAGDAFMAGLLVFLLRHGRHDLSGALRYANACGALAATERGAAMEGLSEAAVQNLLAAAP